MGTVKAAQPCDDPLAMAEHTIAWLNAQIHKLQAKNTYLRKQLALERQEVADLKHDMERMHDALNELESERQARTG